MVASLLAVGKRFACGGDTWVSLEQLHFRAAAATTGRGFAAKGLSVLSALLIHHITIKHFIQVLGQGLELHLAFRVVQLLAQVGEMVIMMYYYSARRRLGPPVLPGTGGSRGARAGAQSTNKRCK